MIHPPYPADHRVVRFARLIQRLVRASGGPSADAAFGAIHPALIAKHGRRFMIKAPAQAAELLLVALSIAGRKQNPDCPCLTARAAKTP
jgi:hypothetical protein